jgi:hypothetical protein
MTRALQRRLQKLESQVPRQLTEQEKHEKNVQSCQVFLMCAVAYYLGDPTPEGSVAEAYGRALGYPNPHEFRKAWDAKDPDLYERDRLARIKLLAKFGVSFEHEWEEIFEAVKRMEAGLPERYKRCCR